MCLGWKFLERFFRKVRRSFLLNFFSRFIFTLSLPHFYFSSQWLSIYFMVRKSYKRDRNGNTCMGLKTTFCYISLLFLPQKSIKNQWSCQWKVNDCHGIVYTIIGWKVSCMITSPTSKTYVSRIEIFWKDFSEKFVDLFLLKFFQDLFFTLSLPHFYTLESTVV